MLDFGLSDEIMETFNNKIFKLDSILEQKYFRVNDVKNKLQPNIKNFLTSLFFEINEIPTKELLLYSNKDLKILINKFFEELEKSFPIGNSKNIFKQDISDEVFEWDSLIPEKQIRCIKKLLTFKYTKLYEKLRDDFGKKLIINNNIFICPYCKRNYINVIVSKNHSKSVKPDLDHFYPKSIYPFLGISLSNLIPSCLTCNQRCKGNKDTFEEFPHIFPPENVFRLLTFSLPIHNKILMKIDNNYSKYSTTEKEVKNHLETFLIEETYKSHIEIAELIKEKHDKYSSSKISDLVNTTKGLTMNDIRDIVFYEYEKLEKDNDREPLSKLKWDLYNDIVKK